LSFVVFVSLDRAKRDGPGITIILKKLYDQGAGERWEGSIDIERVA
jgi:hypothetical protein